MGTIDFLQSSENNKPKSGSKKQNSYSIEYTDPSDLADHFAKPAPVRPAPAKPAPVKAPKPLPVSSTQSQAQPNTKKKRSWFSFGKKKTATVPLHVPIPVTPSTPLSAPTSTRATTAQAPVAIGRAPQQVNAATSQPAQKPVQKSAQKPIARQIPLAPPPPKSVSTPAPVQSPQTLDASLPHFQMQEPQQSTHIPTAPQPSLTQPVLTQPDLPTPTPSVPKPTTELRTVEQKGAIHAQNVSRISGKETDPEPMEEAPFEVNLLPASLLKELTPESKASRLVKTVLVTTTCIGLVYMGMIMYRAYFIYQTKNNQIEITRLENEIATYSTLQTDINAANTTVVAIDDLLNQHVYWTNFFALLEQYTLPNVQYVTFSGNVEGNVTLQAVTTDFASVSRQVEVFRDAPEFITNVSVSTATRTSIQGSIDETSETTEESDTALLASTVEFAISATVNPDIFLYESQSLLQ